MMPEMDGYQVLEQLRSDDELRHLPVIVISALDDLDSAIRCIQLGADDYLLKPFNPTLLRARIRSSLERKRLRDREQLYLAAAQDANQAKSDFISFIAHELKTPLTTVRGYIDVLTLGIGGALTPKQTQYLATMCQSVEMMTKLVSDLADIERIESGQIALQRRAIHLPGVVMSVAQSLSSQLNAKEQTLTMDIDPQLPLVMADQLRMTQVLTNLLSNAHKYTPDAGAIKVFMHAAANQWDVERGGEVVHVGVSDTGIGISAADQVRIFEKYFRSSNEHAWNMPGTGLGLNISRRLIELQGGRIWCDSVLGEGTTFHFTLPIALDQ